jgi:hypothetical protein
MTSEESGTGGGGNRRLSAVLGGGSLLPAAVLELGLKLCIALRETYAVDETDHGLEPDEREFRPENVLLTSKAEVVSGDLGLPDFGAPPKDRPLYRAPEEFKGAHRDARSDVFVLGALLYEATVGEPLFDGPTGADARYAVEHGLEGHLVLKDVVRTIDARIEGLGPVVAACLKADPSKRYSQPALLGAALARLMATSGLQPGSLVKRVSISQEADVRSVSTPAAPAPRPNPAQMKAKMRPAPPVREDPAAPPSRPPQSPSQPAASSPSPHAPLPPAGPPIRAPRPDVDEQEPLAPISSPRVPAVPDSAVRRVPAPQAPAPPSWMQEDEEGGPSVELSIEDVGRSRSTPAQAVPPPPLEEAGDGFKLQSEDDPASTWNRIKTVGEAPVGLADGTDGFDRSNVEKVPLRRTELSLKKPKEVKDETFLGAVRWFASRVFLYAFFLATIVFALAWYDVFPVATSKAASRAWSSTPQAIKDALPDPWTNKAVELWTNRVGAGAGTGIGSVVVKVVPDDVARTVEEAVAGADPTPTPLDAGSPKRDGVIAAIAGWVEPLAGLPPGEGALLIEAELEGKLLTDTVRVELLDGEGKRVAEGLAGASITALPGEYSVRTTYSESEVSGEHIGSITGVVIHAEHRSRYRAPMKLRVGFLDTRFLVDAVDVSTDVVLSGWPVGVDQAATKASWSGPGGTGLALHSGIWAVQASYDDGKHAVAILDLGEIDVPPQHGRVARKKSMQQGEELNPTGPGLDLEVSNFGEDISGRTEIYVYTAGSDVRNAMALANGRGAYYFDVAPGQYDVRLVFRPSLGNEDVVGEKVITGFVVPETGVKRTTIDMGFAYSTLDVVVSHNEEDVSESVRAVVIGPGASFEGATRVLDDELGKELVLISGAYDIYLVFDGPEGEVRRHFPMVNLRQGRTWEQRFSMNDAEWVARN